MVDVLLKNGLIVDPSRAIHARGSLAIKDGRIEAVNDAAAEAEAGTVYDLEGKIIAPGLIDIHCHPGEGFSWLGISADEIGVRSGITLLCDGGDGGPFEFRDIAAFHHRSCKNRYLLFPQPGQNRPGRHS